MLNFIFSLIISIVGLCSTDSYQWYSVRNFSPEPVYINWTSYQGAAEIDHGALVVEANGEQFIATYYGEDSVTISVNGEVVGTALPNSAACGGDATTFPTLSAQEGCSYVVDEEGNSQLTCDAAPVPVEPEVCQQDVQTVSDTELYWAEGQSTGVQFLAGTTAKLNECYESGWCSIHYAEADYFVPQDSLVSWGC